MSAASPGQTSGAEQFASRASDPAAPSSGSGGRAFGLGPRTLAVLVVLALAGLVGLLLASEGSSSTPAASQAKYGGLPSWLPKPKHLTRRTLAAGVGHPAVSIQGEAIAVHLASGNVYATVVGPEVPEEGRFPVPATSPVSFVLTFARTSGTVPLRAADLELVDGRGGVHHPVVTALHGGPLPAHVPTGKPFSVRLRGVLPTGDGAVEWKPAPGRPLAGWAFTVEID
jgi:hypothetical protein